MKINHIEDIIDIVKAENNISLDTKLITGNILNDYFNYKYIKEKDELIVNFEVNEGSASFKIINASCPEFDFKVSLNEIANAHKKTNKYNPTTFYINN